MTKSLGGWILAGTIAFGSVMAYAVPDIKGPYPTCSTPPSESDRKAAQGAFAAGQGSFNEADYPTAIMYWRDAYRRDCTAHALLLNLARAYELKSDRAEAIAALEAYLQRKPDDPNAEQIQRRIQNLKTQMNSQPSAAPSASASAPPSASASAPLPPLSPPATAPATRLNIAPLVVAGVGAAIAIAGIPFFATGMSKVNDAEKTCPTHEVCGDEATISLGNKGRDQVLVGGVLMTAGAIAIGTGAVWYFLAPKKGSASAPTEGPVSLRPAVAPGFAGLSLGGSF